MNEVQASIFKYVAFVNTNLGNKIKLIHHLLKIKSLSCDKADTATVYNFLLPGSNKINFKYEQYFFQ